MINDKEEHFNGLSNSETERLAWLMEEMGEAQQAIGKILRHGYKSSHPDIKKLSNRKSLTLELGHVICAIDLLVINDDVDYDDLKIAMEIKSKKIKEWMHHEHNYEELGGVKENRKGP